MLVQKLIFSSIAVIILAFATGCGRGETKTPPNSGSQAADASRCPHEIRKDKCPFCNPALIEADGFCGEHGVAEALCYQCRPYLKAAFRAKGDWCTEHNVPESQCILCNPKLKENVTPGQHGAQAAGTSSASPPAAGNCEHGIAQAKCPFCTPSLIETDGFCKGHDVAEALCVKCRPYLQAAFVAKGDWCKEHATPESQCVLCHPELKSKGGTNPG